MAARQRRGPRWALIVLSGIVSALLGPGACAQIKQPEGGEVTMEANYTGDPTEINWKKDGNKVVDMELKPLYTHFYNLQGRATISPTDGSLTIRNLTVGDSGHYKAEALVNNIIHETHYDLTVIACPAKPTISDHSNEDKTELSCESKTPGVTYQWWKQTRKVAQSALYTANRPREDVALTCVVYVDKDMCKNEASITIHFIPARVTVEVGDDVTLTAEYTGDPTEIKWMLDGDKVAYMKLKPEFNIGLYRERANISRTNGDLTIRNLEVGDAGLYRAEVLANNIIQETFIHLTVNDNRLPTWMIGLIVSLAVIALIYLGIAIYCYKRWSKIKANLCIGCQSKSSFINIPPINMTEEARVTCKKNGQQLNEDGRIQRHPDEDLPINNVTSADKGTYTAHCYNQAPEETISFAL